MTSGSSTRESISFPFGNDFVECQHRPIERRVGQVFDGPMHSNLRNSSRQKNEKLLNLNGLYQDTFWKKELPDGYGSESGVGHGNDTGANCRNACGGARTHSMQKEIFGSESSSNACVFSAKEARCHI